MNKKILIPIFALIIGFVILLGYVINNRQPDLVENISIGQAFPNLTFTYPVDFQTDNSNDNLIYIVEQHGIIKSFIQSNDQNQDKIFIDLRSKVLAGGERGLLGLAFHPDYANNGLFYVDYTSQPDGRTIIAEYKAINNVVDLQSERLIFQQNQPYSNHNAGQILFGMDGYLYITLGDGGSAGDPQNNAQSRFTFLGSILRIDVNHQFNGRNYSIPLDNPYVNNSNGYKEEIFAYGLRNPWRLSQDEFTGMLWAGDVGQNAHEEIDIIEKGKNYGWPIMEGFSCYKPSFNCNKTGLILPITDYGRTDGFAVTGGYVYRGGAIQSLYGSYIFADYGSGKIWKISPNNNVSLLFDSGLTISSFGLDSSNEIYFFDYSAGKIYTFINHSLSNSSVTSGISFLSLSDSLKVLIRFKLR